MFLVLDLIYSITQHKNAIVPNLNGRYFHLYVKVNVSIIYQQIGSFMFYLKNKRKN